MSFGGLLQHIHNARVLHNDIATRNLLVSDAGRLVIVDFGNAIVVHRRKRKTFKGEMEQLRRVLGQSASEIGPHS
jgi:tRNA A-37 threonylcarbamoyl transferase component Bud32